MERPRSRVRETGAFHVRNSRTASTATKQYDELAPLCMTKGAFKVGSGT
jgi:hypothetical protein